MQFLPTPCCLRVARHGSQKMSPGAPGVAASLAEARNLRYASMYRIYTALHTSLEQRHEYLNMNTHIDMKIDEWHTYICI